MSRNARRLLFSALISISGFAATTFWYQSGLKKSGGDEGRKKIAVLVRALNEVQRKPDKRVIWETIPESEPLYLGEAIRTSENSEASIEFLGSKTRIELEPDSLIVLEESAGSIALNFLKGNLFVSGGSSGEGVGDLSVKTGTTSVKLSNASASLSKSGASLGVQVLKGTAQVDANGKTAVLDESKSGIIGGGQVELAQTGLKVLSPEPNSPIYINPAAGEMVIFQWEKLDPNYEVRLEVGSRRNKLSPMAGAKANGAAGVLKAPVKTGGFYWRLVATSSNPSLVQRSTLVQKNEAIAKIPPILLSPADDEIVVLSQESPLTAFTWSNPARLEKMTIEIGKTADLSAPLLRHNVNQDENFEVHVKKDGTYYWRVRGFMKGVPEELVSVVRRFRLKTSLELLPPELKKPVHLERLSYQNLVNSRVALSWEEVPGVKKYQVQIQLKKSGGDLAPPITEEVQGTEYRLGKLEPGIYSWSVVSVDATGKKSRPSLERTFQIDTLPRLAWADQKDTPLNHQYFTDKPTFVASWQRGPPTAVNYRIRVAPEGELQNETPWSSPALSTTITQQVSKDGRYEFEVEALDLKGEVVAKSPRRVVQVQALPLLPPPKFASHLPPQLTARNNGSADVDWDPVPGASRYVLELRSDSGTVVREADYQQTQGHLNNLMPGVYKISLKTVDQRGRRGPASEERELKVPDRSDSRAPKIKAIKVK